MPEELMRYCEHNLKKNCLSADEIAMYSFIAEWLSPANSIIVATSGSTNKPKEMVFQKRQLVQSAQMTCNYLGIDEKMNLLLCLSAQYIAGKMMIVRAFTSGANLVTVSATANALANLNERIDFAAMVPLQVKQSIEDSSTCEKFRAIPNVIIGGAALSPLMEVELATFPNRIYSTFGMTETLSHIALRLISGAKRSNLYEALAGITISADERNCLIVTAPFFADEPIVTNDIIALKDDTHFQWLGRFDNMINSGAIKIYPELLESKIARLFPNRRFFVAGIPDEILGQKVVLIAEGIMPVADAAVREIERLIGKYESPKFYFTVNRFTETPNGKIQRKLTLENAMKQLRESRKIGGG